MKKTLFIIFGATGDLAKRYIIPALVSLAKKSELKILAIGRKELTTESFMKDYSKEFLTDKEYQNLREIISYVKINYQNEETYSSITKEIEAYEPEQIIAYCSTPPQLFTLITENLHKQGITEKNNFKIAYEKPFGSDLKSATILQNSIIEKITEDKIYRVDHYLGKRIINQIIPFRTMPEYYPLWNKEFIDSIHISISETLGVGTRGTYYDKSGALKDMTQNHLFQILGLVTLKIPEKITAEAIRSAKAKVFSEIIPFHDKRENIIFGQYTKGIIDNKEVKGYLEEENIETNSRTETFVALKVEIENNQWKEVPLYISTGKRLQKRFAEIVISFKQSNNPNIPKKITFSIQPTEFISIEYNDLDKKIILQDKTLPKQIDCNGYCNIIEALIQGNKSLFTRWDELFETWKLLDEIINCKNNCPILHPYESGSLGPEIAQKYLLKH